MTQDILLFLGIFFGSIMAVSITIIYLADKVSDSIKKSKK